MTPHELRIDATFKALKMPGAARTYRALIREAEEASQSLEAFLDALLQQELHNRQEHPGLVAEGGVHHPR
jgi:hypothetical protein